MNKLWVLCKCTTPKSMEMLWERAVEERIYICWMNEYKLLKWYRTLGANQMSVIKVIQGKLLKWENLLLNNTCFVFFCISTGVRKCHFHFNKIIWNIISILAIEIILEPIADSNVCLPITHLCDVNSLYLLRFGFLSSPGALAIVGCCEGEVRKCFWGAQRRAWPV